MLVNNNIKLILLEGGPASGKNTLGSLLINIFQKSGKKAVLLDRDTYVEEFNPKWIWESESQKEKDQLHASINFSRDVDKHLKSDYNVIAIGEYFSTKKYIKKFISRININCPVLIYHLSTPFLLREKRLHARGPHSLIDLKKSQKQRDRIKVFPGCVYENIHSPDVDATNLMSLIQKNKGLLSIRKTK